MFRSRVKLVVVTVAAASLMLAGCGSSSDGKKDGAEGPVRVLLSAGLSAAGALADNSNTSRLSAEASAAVLNKDGGILGRKVEVTVVDDGGDPTNAVTKLREYIASKGAPDVYLNSGPSTITAATLPILAQNKVLSFNIGATADSPDPSKYPLNFDLTPSATDFINGIGAYMSEQGYKSVGVIHGNSAYGALFGSSVGDAMAEFGVKVVGNEEYDVASLDMTPQLEKIKQDKPEALIMDGYGAPVGYLLKGVEKLQWDIPIVGNTSVAATGLMSNLPPDGLVGTAQASNVKMEVFASTQYSAEAVDVNEAVMAMAKLGKIKSTLILAYNYDALRLLKAAADKVGSLDDAGALAKALESDEVTKAAATVIIPKYNFNTKSHAPSVGAEAFGFVSPSVLKSGQFQP